MPDAPTPNPLPNATVAVTPTPTGAPPPVSETPRETRTTKTYSTGLRSRGVGQAPPGGHPPIPAQPAAPGAAAQAPAAAPAKQPEGQPVEPAAAAAPAAETPAAPEAPKLDDTELAKRLGQITRQEQQVARREQQLSGRVAIAQAVEQVLGPANTSPAAVQQALRQVQQVQQGREAAHKDPVGFLQRVFGIDPRHTIELAINGAIAANGGKAPDPAAPDPTRVELDSIRAQLEKEAQARETERVQGQVREYVSSTVAPILADTAKFKHLLHYCELTGGNAPLQLYNAMVQRFQQTGQAPDPKALAEEFETQLQSRYAPLLGTNAAPAQQAAPKREETPAAPAPVSRRVTTPDPVVRTRPRLNGKPYTVKPL
jgi:hypothetical protein